MSKNKAWEGGLGQMVQDFQANSFTMTFQKIENMMINPSEDSVKVHFSGHISIRDGESENC